MHFANLVTPTLHVQTKDACHADSSGVVRIRTRYRPGSAQIRCCSQRDSGLSSHDSLLYLYLFIVAEKEKVRRNGTCSLTG